MKNYGHVLNQVSQIFQNAKFRAKEKNLEFGTKNTIYGCIWECYFEKLLPYLKSPPLNLSKRKNWCKRQNESSLGPKKFM